MNIINYMERRFMPSICGWSAPQVVSELGGRHLVGWRLGKVYSVCRGSVKSEAIEHLLGVTLASSADPTDVGDSHH